MKENSTNVAPAAPLRRDERINEFSARTETAGQPIGEMLEYGEANEADARASGYTDASGHAVEMAKSHDGTHRGPRPERDSDARPEFE